MIHIAVIGPPCVGKTTTLKYLENKYDYIQSVLVGELMRNTGKTGNDVVNTVTIDDTKQIILYDNYPFNLADVKNCNMDIIIICSAYKHRCMMEMWKRQREDDVVCLNDEIQFHKRYYQHQLVENVAIANGIKVKRFNGTIPNIRTNLINYITKQEQLQLDIKNKNLNKDWTPILPGHCTGNVTSRRYSV